jgi:uncharacterized OB-fold protein
MIQRDVPEPSEVSQPFWDATRRRVLVLQWCTECDRGIYYPRLLCPRCGSAALRWRESAGHGTVYAQATHYPAAPVASDESFNGRYSVVLVDLDDGVRMLSNVVGIDPDEVHVGQRLALSWEPLADGRALPVFAPTTQTSAT